MSHIWPPAVARLPSEIYGMSHWLQLTTESFWENWSQWFRWIRLITGYYLHGWHLLILSGGSESCGRMASCSWQWYYYTDQVQTLNITSDPLSLGTFSHHHPSLSWRQQQLQQQNAMSTCQHANMPPIWVFYVMSGDSKAYWEMRRGMRCEVTQYKECYQSQYSLPLPPLHHNLAKIYHRSTMKFPLNINTTIATVFQSGSW